MKTPGALLVVTTILAWMSACDCAGPVADDVNNADGDAAATDTSAADTLISDNRVADTLGNDGSVADADGVDTQVADIPVADVVSIDTPVTDIPVTDIPVADVVGIDTPVPDIAAPDIPVADIPVADIPVADIPVPDIPVPDTWVADTFTADTQPVDVDRADASTADLQSADSQIVDAAPGDLVSTDASSICEASGSGVCYYISPEATGSCTFADPCSFDSAVHQLAAGDYLYFLSGTYSTITLNKYFHFQEPAPTESSPVTLKAYLGQHAVIQGDYTQPCMFLDGTDHMVIEGLNIRQCWQAGIRIGYDVPTADISVRNCEFDEIICDDNMGGVYIGGASQVLVEANTFHDLYYEGTRADLNTSACRGLGLIVFRGQDITIRNNEFYNTCSGMYYKHGEAATGNGGYTHVYGNYFHDLGSGNGIATNQNRTEIRGNLLEGCGILLHNEDGTQAPFTYDVAITYNTIVDGSVQFPWQGGSGTFPGPRRTSVLHNIFANSEYHIWTYGSDAIYNEGIELQSDDNCFSIGQTVDYFGSSNPSYGGANTGCNCSLTEFQALGFDSHSLQADPGFDDAANHDYHIQAGAMCAEMGMYAAP